MVKERRRHMPVEPVHLDVVFGARQDLELGPIALEGVNGRGKVTAGAEHDSRIG